MMNIINEEITQVIVLILSLTLLGWPVFACIKDKKYTLGFILAILSAILIMEIFLSW